MSKKTLKRSLALGALMAFVITGSAMAAEINYTTTTLGNVQADSVEIFKEQSGLVGVCNNAGNYYGTYYAAGARWSAFYPTNSGESPDILVTTGDITYGGGPLGLYAGYHIGDNDSRLDNKDGNELIIKHNLTVSNGSANLYAFGFQSNDSEASASNNSIYVGGQDKPIIIKLEGQKDSHHIFIGGAVSINHKNILNVEGNKAIVDNVKFELSENNYVCVYGGEARGGSAKDNEVFIKNTVVTNAEIFGGFVHTNGGDASKNTVSLNNVTLGQNSTCAGGFVLDNNDIVLSGNADSNTINIEGNSIVAGNLYGGYSDNGSASNNTINIKDTADVSKAKLYGDNDATDGTGNTLNIESGWYGSIDTVENFDTININDAAVVTLNTVENCDNGTVKVDGSILELKGITKFDTVTTKNNGKIVFGEDGHLDVNQVEGSLIITEAGKTADDLNTADQLTTVAEKLGVAETAKETVTAKVVMAEGKVKGETTGVVSYKTEAKEGYYHGYIAEEDVTEKLNTTNASVNNTLNVALMAWRAENNDMNKRLGELRNANGEHGVWVRMVNGESEYKDVENEYKTYQLGYDEKLSVDPSWTVGAAVSYTEADTTADKASGENKHKGFSVYGSKLNDDGSFVDLIAKVARIEHDFNVAGDKGDWSSNGYSLSAEYGKRLEQGNGLWIEPQVELTYGKISSAECELPGRTVTLEDMESLVGRVGFSLGKDIKQGNIYARASYLYDFEGETTTKFSDGKDTRSFEQDLGGGWWEVGVGANINLSKATYIYADVEKTFGGEVDTNWQWNLGVRYSF